MINKKAQEEMVGFALIVIIVGVILLMFLVFSITKENVEEQDVEAQNFINGLLPLTTDCVYRDEYMSLQDLLVDYGRDFNCENGRSFDEVLNETIKGLIDSAWVVGGDTPVKGYEMDVLKEGKKFVDILEGNVTQNYRSYFQPYTLRGNSLTISFKAYY